MFTKLACVTCMKSPFCAIVFIVAAASPVKLAFVGRRWVENLRCDMSFEPLLLVVFCRGFAARKAVVAYSLHPFDNDVFDKLVVRIAV